MYTNQMTTAQMPTMDDLLKASCRFAMQRCQNDLGFLALQNMKCRMCGTRARPELPRTLHVCKCLYADIKRALPEPEPGIQILHMISGIELAVTL